MVLVAPTSQLVGFDVAKIKQKKLQKKQLFSCNFYMSFICKTISFGKLFYFSILLIVCFIVCYKLKWKTFVEK